MLLTFFLTASTRTSLSLSHMTDPPYRANNEPQTDLERPVAGTSRRAMESNDPADIQSSKFYFISLSVKINSSIN